MQNLFKAILKGQKIKLLYTNHILLRLEFTLVTENEAVNTNCLLHRCGCPQHI